MFLSMANLIVSNYKALTGHKQGAHGKLNSCSRVVITLTRHQQGAYASLMSCFITLKHKQTTLTRHKQGIKLTLNHRLNMRIQSDLSI